MKTTLYSLALAAATCGLAGAQATTAYTTPVGYSTTTLAVGLNAVGLTLQGSAIAAGSFETVAGTVLTDSETTYSPVAGRRYILEITSAAVPALVGTIQEVPAASLVGSTVTTPDNLGALGLAVGDRYILRLAPTLEEIFTTTPLSGGGVLAGGGLNYTSADIVWIPIAPGSFDRYFLKTGTGAGFQRITGPVATNFTPAPNVSVIYADGIFIQKKAATAASLTISGEVKTKGTNSVLSQGLNLIGQVAPVGLTLRNAGFEDDITASLTVAGADIVWLQNPTTLAFTKYMRTGTVATGTWKTATGTNGVNLDPLVDPPITGAFYIQRKSATQVTLDLNVPPSFNSL
jgi:hypothetical protein